MKINYIKIAIIGLLAVVIILVLILTKDNSTTLLYQEGQIGIITKDKEIKVNDKVFKPYQTTKNSIKISFESFNINEEYNNQIIINDDFSLPISPKNNIVNEFVLNEYNLLGLNIVNGNLKITFKVGNDLHGKVDSFWIRNTILIINNTIIKPNEEQENYIIVSKLGKQNMKEPLRVDYTEEVTLTFSINKKLLKDKGLLLKENSEEIIVISKNKEKVLKNPAYIKFNASIKNNEVLSGNKTINVESFDPNIRYELFLNGIKIDNNFELNSKAWAVGNHELEILATNSFGFSKREIINFELTNDNIEKEKLNYIAYDLGLNKEENTNILSNAKEISNILNYDSKFDDESKIYFSVNSDSSNIIWEGETIPNRVLVMEVYDYKNLKWVVKSVSKSDADNVILGFKNYKNANYINDQKLLVKVKSLNISKERLIDTFIYHVTDIQYITRNGTSEISTISNIAKTALNDMANYIVKDYKDNILSYVIMTGDFVQSTVVNGEIEWPVVMNNFFNPLLENDVPFGVTSGNHDIGALNENTPEGSDALDEFLIYDLWYENLSEDIFKDFDYYGGSFENNRSHFDLLTINNHEFLFLYLGWGSSIKGIHVSEKDIEWAKMILDVYPNKTVVIAVHEYMSHSGNRSKTGDYLFDELIKKYKNIKFVFSGHINGSSNRIDIIDDNNDGIADRKVMQLLTNFQEESINNLGASFIRRIGLDFANSRMIFDLYSPVANDNKIFVASRGEIVKKNSDFTYDFDLNNYNFGLKTIGFGL